jgi:hypothetical protein
MTDTEPQPSERPPRIADPKKTSSSSDTLKGALIGAALAFLVGMMLNYWSNYLTRRDQHIQEAEKCDRLTASLISTTTFAREVAKSAAASIAAAIPPDRATNKFVLPPLDEILHSEDQSLDILDTQSRDSVLNVEAYYRSVRDDLSNTPGVYHTGETFGVPASSGNKDAYENILKHLAETADDAARLLSTGGASQCNNLATTDFFWPSVRHRNSAAAR